MTSQFIVEFSQIIDSCFEIDKACTTTFTLAKCENTTHTRHESIEIPESSHTHALHHSNPGTPSLLSPTSSASSPSTPRNRAFPWDSPQTPSQRLDPASFDLSTPLTPPGTSEGTLKTNLSTFEHIQATPCRTGPGHERSEVGERSPGMRKLIPNARDSQIMISFNHNNHANEPMDELFHDPGSTSDGVKDESVEDSTAESHMKIDHTVNPETIPSIPDASGDDVDSRSSQQTSSRSTSPGQLMISNDLQGTVGPVDESILSAISRRSKISVLDVKGTAYRQDVVLTEDVEPTRSTSRLQSVCQTVTEMDVVQPPLKFDRASLPTTVTHLETSVVNTKHQGQMTRTTTPHVGTKRIECHVGVSTVSQIMKSFKDLRTTLNRILPFEFTGRMSYDPNRCVVNYVGESFQCRATAEGNEYAIDASIEAITSCIKSSDYLALPDHIKELVANTRCGRHKPKESALSQAMDTLRDLIVSLSNVSGEDLSTFGTWLEAISNSDAPAFAVEAVDSHHQFTWAISLSVILDRIMPIRMQARLGKRPNRCVVASCKELHSECDDRLEEQRCVVNASIGTIVQCIAKSNYSGLPGHFGKLAQAVMCRSHRDLADSDLHLLRAIIRNLAHVSSQYLSAFRAWIRAIAGCELPPLSAAVTDTLLPDGTVTVFGIDAVKVRADNTAPHFSSKFTPYRAKSRSNHEIAEALRSKVEKPLTDSDMKDGFVYMFWDQQNFGMIKIGHTIDLEKRLNQWNSQCKVTHHYHQSSRDGELLKIPHVHRIEKLMHIELGNYRKKRACDGCGKNHIEWFDIDEAKAKKVFQKWRDWINQKPYAQDHSGDWTIKSEMLDSLSEVCKPVVFSDADVKMPQPRRERLKDGSKRRTSRRPARLVNVH